MDALIINASRTPHQNTRRIAEAIGSTLHAPVIRPEEAEPETVGSIPLVGFGSGIRWMQFDKQLVDLIENLPAADGRAAFIFATSGLPEPPFRPYTRRLSRTLEHKGYRVIGTFTCRGVDTWGPFKLAGGVSKNRPSTGDIDAAQLFAASLSA